jgi:hypothetical protein
MVSHTHNGASESFWISCALILAAFVYLRGWLRLRRQDCGTVEGWRAGSFFLGVLFTWVATASPLAALDHEMLTAHMAQHLLLMTLAPPPDLAWHASKTTGAWLDAAMFTDDRSSIAIRTEAAIRKRGNSSGTLLVCGGRRVSCVAYSFGVYPRPAITSVAWR